MTFNKKRIVLRPNIAKTLKPTKQTSQTNAAKNTDVKPKINPIALDEQAALAIKKAARPHAHDPYDNRTIEQKKKDVIDALKDTLGVAVVACARAKVDFDLFCQWRMHDPVFDSQVARVNDVMLDFVEAKALEQIKAGNARLIQFYLQTKGRARGFDPKETAPQPQAVALLTDDEMNF